MKNIYIKRNKDLHYLHIMQDNANDEVYFVPDDWLHSKDFHYLNEDD